MSLEVNFKLSFLQGYTGSLCFGARTMRSGSGESWPLRRERQFWRRYRSGNNGEFWTGVETENDWEDAETVDDWKGELP